MIKAFSVFTVALLATVPAFAQNGSALCKLRQTHSNTGAAYQPGVDVRGRPVVSADVNGSSQGMLDKISIPVTVDLARNLALTTPTGTEMKGVFGLIDIYKDGTVKYNGQDITSNAVALCDAKAAIVPVTPVAAPAPVVKPAVPAPQPAAIAPAPAPTPAPVAPSQPVMTPPAVVNSGAVTTPVPNTAPPVQQQPAVAPAPAAIQPPLAAPVAPAPQVPQSAPAQPSAQIPSAPAAPVPAPMPSGQLLNIPTTPPPAAPPATAAPAPVPSAPEATTTIRPPSDNPSQQYEQDEIIWGKGS